MSGLTRDGTVEPASRDQFLRLERGYGKYYLFPCSADHEQDWQPYPVDPYSAESLAIHTYTVHTVTSAFPLPRFSATMSRKLEGGSISRAEVI